MATLEVLDGPRKGQVFQVESDETIIGRNPYCDIVLNLKNVSRRHTKIIRQSDNYFVEDLGSTNGTFLNGRRVDGRLQLKDCDRVKLYDATLTFRIGEPIDGATRTVKRADLVRVGDVDLDVDPIMETGGLDDDARNIVNTLDAKSGTNLTVNASEKLRAVLELNKTLGGALNIDEVLPKILDGLFAVFPQSERGYVLFPDEETGELAVRVDKYKKDDSTDLSLDLGPISQTVANRVMAAGEAILSADGFDDEEFEISDSVLDFPIRSMMCAPLIGPSHKPVGIIYVDTNDPRRKFAQDDLEVLLSVATTAGQAVEYAHLHEAQLQIERQRRDLETAKEVQLHFLPKSRPEIEGYEFFDFYRSAQVVGGDYYGYLPLSDGRLAITLGDVSGKGISAALMMARLCSEVRYGLAESGDAVQAIDYLNQDLSKPEHDDWFVTFVMSILDTQNHKLTIVNAGHMAPLCRRGTGELEELGNDVGGPPLGCSDAIRYSSFTTDLHPGDSIILYTDGISEAMNPSRELYGMERIRDFVGRSSQNVERMCKFLLADMRGFTSNYPQSDDICLLGLQRVN